MERNEAIDVIKKNYPHVAESGSQFETALRILIPELKGSKDERIRKSLVDYFAKFKQSDMWDDEFSFGDILAWFEKKSEQNLANSAKTCKDKQHIDSLLKRLDGLCRNEFERTRFAINEYEDWLKSLKDRYTWKPSDEQNIYKNGVYQETNGVRIWHNGHTFLVPKDWNKGKWPLLNKKGEENSKQNKEHLMSEIDALLDWNFVAATKHIQDLGTDIPLKDGEYLITAPVWLAMYEHRIALNKALSNIGAMEIDFNEDFWFAERYGVHRAWIFHGTYRNLNGSGVASVLQVGAVTL